jgi:hypothetical protein
LRIDWGNLECYSPNTTKVCPSSAANGKAARIHLQQDMLHLKKTGYDVWTQCVIDMVDAGLKGGQ